MQAELPRRREAQGSCVALWEPANLTATSAPPDAMVRGPWRKRAQSGAGEQGAHSRCGGRQVSQQPAAQGGGEGSDAGGENFHRDRDLLASAHLSAACSLAAQWAAVEKLSLWFRVGSMS